MRAAAPCAPRRASIGPVRAAAVPIASRPGAAATARRLPCAWQDRALAGAGADVCSARVARRPTRVEVKRRARSAALRCARRRIVRRAERAGALRGLRARMRRQMRLATVDHVRKASAALQACRLDGA